ncbi:xaa-Pro dipeptidase [Planoprotostelium fungivorum]|uniref:Xaa-Pro dipeptidase n=1 Tax=Planoprotostelium fungivorum TaxID=1890364 RepID=A0A2P6NIN3_9EUKA|nr:xaa-Pro dipeptidase [Planoprotostelium fungivorum]
MNPATRPFRLNAKDHVKKVLSHLKETEGVIFHSGGHILNRYDTDVEYAFRQESNFFYLTGVEEPGFHVLINVADGQSILVAPDLDLDEALWRGMPDTMEVMQSRYDVDRVVFLSQMKETLASLNPSTIFTMTSTDVSKLSEHSKIIKKGSLDRAVWDARLIKTSQEIDLMREANRISSLAHISIMKNARQGMNECEFEALFSYETMRRGCKHQAYGCICGGGTSASILHYVKNDKDVNDPKTLVLVDAGAEYHCYASDITRTWPIGGKYIGDAKTIYQIVYDMQDAVFNAMKPGVDWEDMHRLANRIGCEGLIKAGILKGSVDEVMASHLPAVFFPHGLGHLIGLDVHEPGGYPEGVDRINEPGIRYLRFRRKLEPGICCTVEPGIYFVQQLVDEAIISDMNKYVDMEVLDRFRKVGGVRIEDCVVVTENGIENLTQIPRKIEEIEALMAQKSPLELRTD